MGTISADQISGALAKAQSIGIVEEPFVVCDTALTLRSLRPEEYAAIFQECEGLAEVEYLMGYQVAHVARSIVEINGVDLREVDFVEVEEVDPAGNPKTIKLEKHDYIRKYVVDSWGKEVVFVVYQKFGEVVKTAEDQAQQGIEFRIPDESAEQQFRRLLGDLKELEDEVPADLLKEILESAGFMRLSTAQELKAAMERTDALKREQEAPAASPVVTPTPAPARAAGPTPEEIQAENERIMAERQPLNRPVGAVPPDPHQSLQAAMRQPVAESAGQPPQPPQQPLAAPVQPDKAAAERAAQIAALEGVVVEPGEAAVLPERPQEVPELTGQRAGVDPKAVVVDQPPSAGLNPRYNPPKRI